VDPAPARERSVLTPHREDRLALFLTRIVRRFAACAAFGPRVAATATRSFAQPFAATLALAAVGAVGGVAARTPAAFADGSWSQISSPPPARQQHTAIYDSARARMVIFGGSNSPGNDTWALSLPASNEPPVWTQLAPTGAPPSGRLGHTAVYDAPRDRMIVFAGYDGTYRNDVWSLDFSGATPAWIALAPAGGPPTARMLHTAIYDPVRERLIVFGGLAASPPRLNDVWALSLAGGAPSWTPLAPAGTPPSARYYHTAIYDAPRDRMIVFGGNDGVVRNDAWALSLGDTAAWTQLGPSGAPPVARAEHTAIADPATDRMIIFAGYDGGANLGDVWELALGGGGPAWAPLAPTGSAPTARLQHTSIYDPVNAQMVMFAGYDNSLRNDTWRMTLGSSPAWAEIAPGGTGAPAARAEHAALYDSARGRMLVFGGAAGAAYFNDTRALALGGSPGWAQIVVPGMKPAARRGHAAIYDAPRDRLIVFGGFDGATHRNDVWALSLAGLPAWLQLSPTGTPPAGRADCAAIYDPLRDRLLLFGGFDGATPLGDAWALSLAGGTPAWSALSPSGAPPAARWGATGIYDPVRDRVVVFGGDDGGALLDDAWGLDLGGAIAWAPFAPSGTPPSARADHAAIYDAGRDRMVMFGGRDSAGARDDLWSLTLGGAAGSGPEAGATHAPKWTALGPTGGPPPARLGHSAIYDPIADRMAIFAGGAADTAAPRRNDTWLLTWAGTAVADVASPRAAVARIASVQPNPFHGETTIRFSLARSGPARLEVFDVSGRRVRALIDGALASGAHAAIWDGADDSGRAAARGVYFLRLVTLDGTATRKVVRR